MIFKFFILSILLHILLAIPINPSGSRQSASNNPAQHSLSREQEEPLDLSTKNRNNPNVPSTPGTAIRNRNDPNVPSTSGTAIRNRNDPNAPSTSGMNFACVQCGKVYKYQSGLTQHKKIIHDGITYDCEKCPKKFARKATLMEHDVVEHNGTGPIFKCDECPYETPRRGNLFSHKKLHDRMASF